MEVFSATWASGRTVRFRSLSWAEYRRFESQFSYDCPAGVYADVYRAVLLEGPPLTSEDPVYQAPAGLVEWVATSLLNCNPFSGRYDDVKRALDMKRAELQSNWLHSARAVMAGLFHYSFEDIDKWDAETFFERLAAAEFVSGRQIEPGDPKSKAKRQKKPVTAGQQEVIQRVQQRSADSRMPMPAEERVYDPVVSSVKQNEENPAQKRPMNDAQRMVAERVRRQR